MKLITCALIFLIGGNSTTLVPHERSLPMPYPAIQFVVRRPLISLSTAAALANETTDDLLAHLEDGSIRYGFDVATPKASRRAVRVFAGSLANYLSHQREARADGAEELLATVNDVFPDLAETIRTSTLAQILDCDQEHALELIHTGALRAVNRFGRGRGNSALVTRSSCVEFLISRRVT